VVVVVVVIVVVVVVVSSGGGGGGAGGGIVPRKIFSKKLKFASIINTFLVFHHYYIYVLGFPTFTHYCVMLAVQQNTYSHYTYINKNTRVVG
jgi:hypothetical protein